ncbi:MAG: SDR family oxidoreductase [Pseudomonadota bacterium]
MELGLQDKSIMIAAASKGLGFGIAHQCALAGARVSIAARTLEDVEAAVEKLRETGADAMGCAFDARNPESITHWRDATLERFGDLYGMVVNAGGPPPGKFDDFSDDDWQSAFELTLLSSIRMIRAVLPAMRERGGGSIVTLTSSSVKEPIDVLLLSNVMRSGVVSLAKSLSQSLASESIRVNNLVPGVIHTDRIDSLSNARAKEYGISTDEVIDRMKGNVPMGRLGTADEFGKAGAFLLSEAASYITGETLVVDGGTMRTVW